MKDPVAKQNIPMRIGCNHPAVMGVGHIDPAEELAPPVRTAVPIFIPHEKKAWLFRDAAAAVAEVVEVDAVAVINLTHELFRGRHHF